MIKQRQSLKSLMSQKASLEVEINELKNKHNMVEDEIGYRQRKLDDIVKQINNISDKPQITEHALLRYIERIKGVNVDEIKKEMMTERNIKFIEEFGSGTFTLNGLKMIVKDKTIITIVEGK